MAPLAPFFLMKFSFQWLKEFVDFPHSPSELADALTHLGLEVEAVAEQGAEFQGVQGRAAPFVSPPAGERPSRGLPGHRRREGFHRRLRRPQPESRGKGGLGACRGRSCPGGENRSDPLSGNRFGRHALLGKGAGLERGGSRHLAPRLLVALGQSPWKKLSI